MAVVDAILMTDDKDIPLILRPGRLKLAIRSLELPAWQAADRNTQKQIWKSIRSDYLGNIAWVSAKPFRLSLTEGKKTFQKVVMVIAPFNGWVILVDITDYQSSELIWALMNCSLTISDRDVLEKAEFVPS